MGAIIARMKGDVQRTTGKDLCICPKMMVVLRSAAFFAALRTELFSDRS
jgi:hypothetical protein